MNTQCYVSLMPSRILMRYSFRFPSQLSVQETYSVDRCPTLSSRQINPNLAYPTHPEPLPYQPYPNYSSSIPTPPTTLPNLMPNPPTTLPNLTSCPSSWAHPLAALAQPEPSWAHPLAALAQHEPTRVDFPLDQEMSGEAASNYSKVARSRSDAQDRTPSEQFQPRPSYATLERGGSIVTVGGRNQRRRREPVESTATDDLEAYTDRYSGHITSQL